MLRSGREITGGLGGGENIELAAEWTTRRWRGLVGGGAVYSMKRTDVIRLPTHFWDIIPLSPDCVLLIRCNARRRSPASRLTEQKTATSNIRPGDINNESEPEGGEAGSEIQRGRDAAVASL